MPFGKRNLYNLEKRFETAEKRLREDPDISDNNKLNIFEFIKECFLRNLSLSRRLKYLSILKTLAKLSKKDFQEWDRKEVEAVVYKLKRSPKNYSEHTLRDFNIALKVFFKWLRGVEGKHVYPKEVAWLPIEAVNASKIRSEDLLTDEEVNKLIEAAESIRDKAFIRILAESGRRISEIGTIQLKDIHREEDCTRIDLVAKGGKPDETFLYDSVPLLNTLLEMHPDKENPEAYLFLGKGTRNYNKPMSYTSLKGILLKCARKAGIKKRVNPHIFRHKRNTELVRHNVQIPIIKKYLGWSPNSRYFETTYLHLANADVKKAILESKGVKLKREEPKQPETVPQKCPFCNTLNDAISNFCHKCGRPLHSIAWMKFDKEMIARGELVARLLKDPVTQEFLKKRIEAMLSEPSPS
jgi:integrase